MGAGRVYLSKSVGIVSFQVRGVVSESRAVVEESDWLPTVRFPNQEVTVLGRRGQIKTPAVFHVKLRCFDSGQPYTFQKIEDLRSGLRTQ